MDGWDLATKDFNNEGTEARRVPMRWRLGIAYGAVSGFIVEGMEDGLRRGLLRLFCWSTYNPGVDFLN